VGVAFSVQEFLDLAVLVDVGRVSSSGWGSSLAEEVVELSDDGSLNVDGPVGSSSGDLEGFDISVNDDDLESLLEGLQDVLLNGDLLLFGRRGGG